jgi:predicted GNAT family acetyltransferase
MPDLEITRHGTSQAGEYRARVAGSTSIGRLTWIARGDVRVAEHTLVPREIGGRGIAARLVEALVTDARAEQFKIDAQCSYVAAQFDSHPEWANLRASEQ